MREDSTGARMNRRGFLRVGALAAAGTASSGFLGACSQVLSGDTADTGKKTLVVANWKNYGSDIPWALKQFKEQSGATVVHQYFNSEQQLLSMLKSGGVGKIDVALPNLAYVQPAIEDNLIQSVDPSTLSNYERLYPKLRDLEELKRDGNSYGIPWMWGTTNLGYNSSEIKDSINTWAVLWDPTYRGKVGFFDDPTTAILTASLYLGENPEDPDLGKVEEALVDLKPNVKTFWSSEDDWTKAFSTGAVTLGNVWSGLAGTMIAKGDPLTYLLPQEGGVGWVDTWTIVTDAPHKELAYQWIDFMTGASFQSQWAVDRRRSPPSPANQEAHEQLGRKVVNRIQDHPEWLERLAMQKGMPQEQLQEWTELWERVKVS